MIYKHTLEDFNLRSQWVCKGVEKDGVWRWFIVEGPSTSSKILQFPVSLPLDAVVVRAWISVGVGSPLTGASIHTVNDIKIKNGIAELTGINATTTTYEARFSFRANGAIYQDTNTHSATMAFGAPTLNIEYTSQMEEAPGIDENAPVGINRDKFDGSHYPRLLDSNMNEKARIRPSRLSLELNLQPLSTAQMEIPPGQPEVVVRDYMELFSPEGTVGIFRVSQVETNYGQHGGQTVYLEQAFTTLDDDLTIGVQPMSGTFREVVSSILDVQSVRRWVVGDVELPDDYEVVYQNKIETPLQAIVKLMQYIPDGYGLEFDTLQYPWVLNLRNFGNESFCECRVHRNLRKVQISIDADSLCTRVFPYGAGEGEDRINLATLTGALYEDADTQDVWGIISRTFTDEDIFDSITLQEVARRYLELHKNPKVSVTLDARSIYAITGETLDKFTLGKVCRLPMPSYGVSMLERVISISFPDVFGDPQNAVITLANKVRNVTDEIADLLREANNSKLLGGTVSTEEIKSSGSDIAIDHPEINFFEVKTYGNLLAAKVRYSSVPSAKFTLTVDGTTISGSADMAQPIDILRYLTTDENGIPLVGEHWVRFTPSATASDTFRVNTTVILKTIEKQ